MPALERPRPVTLTTDFGHSDSYVGQLKGALLSIHSGIAIVDLSHEVPAQCIATGAYILATGCGAFPDRTVHVAVVDPGVGGTRRALAAAVGRHFFVGPDNGILSRVLSAASAWTVRAIENPALVSPTPSPTFHGRDIFAPVAARLACGAPFDEIGGVVEDPVLLPRPAVRAGGQLQVPVVHVDHFGNIIVDLLRSELQEWLFEVAPGGSVTATAGSRRIHAMHRTYSDATSGEPCLLINSADYLEIACPGTRADRTLGVGIGAQVTLSADGPGAADML